MCAIVIFQIADGHADAHGRIRRRFLIALIIFRRHVTCPAVTETLCISCQRAVDEVIRVIILADKVFLADAVRLPQNIIDFSGLSARMHGVIHNHAGDQSARNRCRRTGSHCPPQRYHAFQIALASFRMKSSL